LRLGRSFIGVAAMGWGVQQLVTRQFVRLVPKLPAWVPSPSLWAVLVGVVLVAAGLALLLGRWTRLAAGVLAALILVSFVLLQVPVVVANPLTGFLWTNPLKALALAGGAGILIARSPGAGRPASTAHASLEPLGAVLLALFLLVGGIQHFVYRGFVATLVPSWVPGHMFWTFFTGVALIAGGLGILFRPTARLAATMAALMIFSWVLLLHIPRALAVPHEPGETAGVFEALALSGVALLVAGTRCDRRPEGRTG
jgi:uncharacterized membrane protein